MRQSTNTTCIEDSTFSNAISALFVDSLCAPTAMEVDQSYQEGFDNESISEKRNDVSTKRTSSVTFDQPPPKRFVAGRDEESCSSMRDHPAASPSPIIEIKSPLFSFTTKVTAIMTQ